MKSRKQTEKELLCLFCVHQDKYCLISCQLWSDR